MYWDVLNVRSVAPRTLEVRFADGLTGRVKIDLSFCTGVFEPLKEDCAVSLAFVENDVLTWPSGLDLAPDTLYREIQKSTDRCYVVKARREASEMV